MAIKKPAPRAPIVLWQTSLESLALQPEVPGPAAQDEPSGGREGIAIGIKIKTFNLDNS
jgi:hypothetical protein